MISENFPSIEFWRARTAFPGWVEMKLHLQDQVWRGTVFGQQLLLARGKAAFLAHNTICHHFCHELVTAGGVMPVVDKYGWLIIRHFVLRIDKADIPRFREVF